VELTCLIDPSVPDRVSGDAAKVRQVLINLIGNGVKFTSAGEVSVAVEIVNDHAERNQERVRFIVRDTGIGMKQETQTRLFKAFTQGDSSMSRRFGGSGLGLAISKGLVEAMGGTITVESTPTIGSVFSFILDFTRAEEGSRVEDIAASLSLTKILCVDDNPRVLRSLQNHLQRLGADPVCVTDAVAAIAATREAAGSGRPFDIIFLDNHLPPMQGLALARSLTLIPCKKLPKCVMLTSSSRNPSTGGGLVHVALYLQKPFRFRQVRHCLKAMAGALAPAIQEGAMAQSPQETQVFRGLRVLVAEDNPINQRLVSHMLTKLGLVVDVVVNGKEAVHAARLSRYDVILMDCQMPEMDGYEATAKIRRCGNGRDVPIVALTANAMPSDRQRCYSAGMDHYLAKPFSQSDIVEILSVCLVGRHAEMDIIDQAPPTTVPPFSQSPAAIIMASKLVMKHGLPLVDRDVLIALSLSMPEGTAIVTELIALFKRETPEQLGIISKARELRDGETLARAAHRLKGGCRTLGFRSMEALCINLERAGQGGDLEDVTGYCDQLEESFAQVLEILQA
jgi:two-component system sensor histidine kinase/response regulator